MALGLLLLGLTHIQQLIWWLLAVGLVVMAVEEVAVLVVF
jgi:hypothetical protein